MCDGPRLCFCPCSKHSCPWRDNKSIFIHHDHGCKATAMTPQQLLKHLKTAGDSTHATIFVYLQKLNTLSWGHARQDPGVNSKKIPDSDEEEKEEEKREEEDCWKSGLYSLDCFCSSLVITPGTLPCRMGTLDRIMVPKIKMKIVLTVGVYFKRVSYFSNEVWLLVIP